MQLEPGGDEADDRLLAATRIALMFMPPRSWKLQGQTAPPLTLGLAVSGGSDSLAMLHLFATVASAEGWALEVATVDHRLRPEAADEAREVAQICQRLGLRHETLVWGDHPTRGNLPAAAREARYALLADWARRRNIPHIALGHTADDQAETFLMGLSRAAGLDGLSGMRPKWEAQGIHFHRPFLSESREALRGYLRQRDISWIDDPSNEAYRYSRTKARRALNALAPLGITVAQLSESIHNLARVNRLVRQTTADCAAAICRFETGALVISAVDLFSQDTEMQRRLLVAAIRWISGAKHPPRADSVANLQVAMMHEGRTATLGGCRIARTAKPGAPLSEGNILITREPRAVSGPAPYSPGALWDHRWRIGGPEAPDLEIRALTAEGLAQVKDWRESGGRRAALLVSPALWRGDTLISAPLLPQFAGEYRADLYPSFGSFILSH